LYLLYKFVSVHRFSVPRLGLVFCLELAQCLRIKDIDPKTICVEASENPTMELFDKHGFEVVTVPFYKVSPFGGGLHCCTADVYREGTCEDYFPKQIEGF